MMVQGEVVKTNRKAFIGVVYAYTIVMLGTTLPTPLYPIYTEVFDLSTLMITMIYAVYAAGVISALLVFGHWSDRIGRKYILIPGVLISASSALIFLFSHHVVGLFIGRVLSGFSAGLFTSTATATLINLAPKHKQTLASMIASIVNMIGLGFGPILAGLLAQYVILPLRIVFVVDLIMLIPACIALIMMTEPVQERRKAHWKIQKLSVPKEVRPTFIRAVLPVFASFAMLGLFAAVTPTFLQEIIGVEHKALIGIVVASMFFIAAFSQLFLTKTSDYRVLMIGSMTLFVGIMLVALAFFLGSFAVLLVGGLVSGTGHAFTFRAGLASVNMKTAPQARGEVSSTFFTIAYIATSIPVTSIGLLTEVYGIQIAGVVFTVLVALLALSSAVLLWKKRHEAVETTKVS